MRTLGFRTHVLLSISAAALVVLTLSRPWYAEAPQAPAGQPAGSGAVGSMSGWSQSAGMRDHSRRVGFCTTRVRNPAPIWPNKNPSSFRARRGRCL